MFRITRMKIIGLAMVGVVALGGAIYATTALAAGGASASPAPTQAAQSATGPQLQATILHMLEDHMGLTGARAGEFADEMISHMQGFDENLDVQEMLDWCTQYAGDSNDSTHGPGMMDDYGMMNGTDWGYGGYGMMDDADSAYGGYGMMDDADSAYGGYGMMGGSAYGNDSASDGRGMMGGTPTPDGGLSGRAGNTPGAPGAPDGDFGPAYGGMMSNGTMTSGMMGR